MQRIAHNLAHNFARILVPILILGLGLSWPAAAMTTINVTLVLSDSSAAHREAANHLQNTLEEENQHWRIRVEPMAARGKSRDEDLVITLGLEALRRVLAEPVRTPVWALMVTRQEYQKIVAARQVTISQRPLSALYLDQPASRRIQMLLAALPGTQSLGVLTSSDDPDATRSLREAAAAHGLRLAVGRVTRYGDGIALIDDLKNRIDVLMLLPDVLVVDSPILQPLLLETYRHRLPVMAYSTPLVTAGAMLALYATPEQIGREAGMRLRRSRSNSGVRLPPPDHPDSFEVAVNRSVALSLGIRVPTSELIRQRMAARSTGS